LSKKVTASPEKVAASPENVLYFPGKERKQGKLHTEKSKLHVSVRDTPGSGGPLPRPVLGNVFAVGPHTVTVNWSAVLRLY
jgi:hypothetical protein